MKKIPTGSWILVADGEEARLFRNAGTDYKASLEQVELIRPHDLLDDGPSGHRPPESDEQSTDEATFAKQLAHRLNNGALQNKYQHLVLMADPQTLGQMRPQLHKETERRIIREIAKTFTKAPLETIQKALHAE